MSGKPDNYDVIFNAALSLRRAANTPNLPKDKWGDCISILLFTILNDWERSKNYPRPTATIVVAAELAQIWEDLLVESELQEMEVRNVE